MAASTPLKDAASNALAERIPPNLRRHVRVVYEDPYPNDDGWWVPATVRSVVGTLRCRVLVRPNGAVARVELLPVG